MEYSGLFIEGNADIISRRNGLAEFVNFKIFSKFSHQKSLNLSVISGNLYPSLVLNLQLWFDMLIRQLDFKSILKRI